MRPGLPLLALLLVPVGSALAQADPLPPLPTLDVDATLASLDTLPGPGDAVAEAGLAAEAPGVAAAQVHVSAGVGLPAVTLSTRLDPGLLAPLPIALGSRSAGAPPPLMPRAFADAPPLPEPAGDAGSAQPIARSSLEEPARRDGGPRAAPARDDPGFTTLALGPTTPLDASPVAAGVALGVTGLLAILARLYSRFGRDSVLRAEPRARIHETLAARPEGATLADLAAATGLSRGAVAHHCRMLERHGYLTSRHDGVNRRYALPGARLAPPVRPPTPGERRVLDLLREAGPLTQADLAARLGVTPQAVSQHLLRLRREARVEPRAADGQRRWALPEEPAAPE